MTVLYVDEVRGSSKVVGRGGLLCGVGSRQIVLSAGNSGVNPVVRVQKSVFGQVIDPVTDPGLGYCVESVVIENLIIDGGNYSGVTGILLENVVHCLIRNVTIRNCEVGIHIRDFKGLWSECNTLKHIRMENVKKGIIFTTTGYDAIGRPGNSAAFTSIEDVDITLADNVVGCVGIQLGGTQIVNNPNPKENDSDGIVTESFGPCPVFIDPYSSHLRAVVRLGNLGGVGLKVINGFLHFAQAHLTVIGHNNPTDIGVDLKEAHVYKGFANANNAVYPTAGIDDMFVFYSQFSQIDNSNNLTSAGGFMLITSDISSQNRVCRHSADTTKIDIDVKSLT